MQSQTTGYYRKSLNGADLKRVYALACPRIREYLDGEIAFARRSVIGNKKVLELGCGYGRVLSKLAKATECLVGIDNSRSSLSDARLHLEACPNVVLCEMDAQALAFDDDSFDTVLCLQNGLSAFGASPEQTLSEALRVAKSTGSVICGSYSDAIWPERLRWFQRQSEARLVGPIDMQSTVRGTVVCEDGFVSRTFLSSDLRDLATTLGVSVAVRHLRTGALIGVYRKLDRDADSAQVRQWNERKRVRHPKTQSKGSSGLTRRSEIQGGKGEPMSPPPLESRSGA